MIKQSTPPLCIQCNRPIPKKTTTIFFASGLDDRMKWVTCLRAKPLSLGEAKTHTDQSIVSHRYFTDQDGVRFVSKVSTWDGESYADRYFCNGTCCKRYAYRMAHLIKVQGGKVIA